METTPAFTNIDEYIAMFPADIQARLKDMRAAIKAAVPEATEKISYQMPTFYLEGNLVHFAAFKNHIGFYPTPDGIQAYQEELAQYAGAKGSIRFPLDQPLPLELVGKIARTRAEANLEKARLTPAKKKK